jgi:hypothetical protein
MAIPTWNGLGGTGATDAGGAWAYTCSNPGGFAAGRVVIVNILQDGTTNGAVTSVVGTNIENLAGTDNVWTIIPGANADSSHPCGSPQAARQFVYIGRCLSTTAPTISGANSTSEDLYICDYTFDSVSTGTTLATVIENSSAGSSVNGAGTGTAVTDTGVTTLGPDRLALQLFAANDDGTGVLTGTSFTGETGGNWSSFSGFESASGTDGTVGLCASDMVSAGTVDGGSLTASISSGWGIVGFALIGTTPAATAVPHKPIVALQGVNRGAVW